MKLDTKAIRYLTSDDWRVLNAVEQGSKNHEVVPTPLIQQIAGVRNGSSVQKCISALAKVGLIGKVKNARYDGYRLTYGGLDYLALNAHRRSNVIYSLGNQIGVGKESDVYVTASPEGRQQVLKLHRLGRISFRTVKANRDYLRKRSTGSWMYLSRLAAQKEHAFMRILYREGFPVPEPLAWSRHTIVMEFIDSFPLRMIESVPDPGKLYAELMELIVRLAQRGLIHGDFNEFNILIREESTDGNLILTPILIDFPQIVSTNHVNAQYYFDRDVECIRRYFERRFKYTSDEPGPFFRDALQNVDIGQRLDVEVEASGFSKKMGKELERYTETTGGDEDQVQPGEDEARDLGEDATDDDELEKDNESVNEDEDAVNGESPIVQPEDSEALGNGPAIQGSIKVSNFGLQPLDLSSDPEASALKIQSKKKATGWAI